MECKLLLAALQCGTNACNIFSCGPVFDIVILRFKIDQIIFFINVLLQEILILTITEFSKVHDHIRYLIFIKYFTISPKAYILNDNFHISFPFCPSQSIQICI